MPTSLSRNPERTGAYLRRMQDIDRTIKELKLNREPHHIRFIMGYLACEKAAIIMQAIHERKPTSVLDERRPGRQYKLAVSKVIAACRHFDFRIDDATIHALFDGYPKPSARTIRNTFFHDMGPTHLRGLRRPDLIKMMGEFLGCIEVVEKWIEKNGTP